MSVTKGQWSRRGEVHKKRSNTQSIKLDISNYDYIKQYLRDNGFKKGVTYKLLAEKLNLTIHQVFKIRKSIES